MIDVIFLTWQNFHFDLLSSVFKDEHIISLEELYHRFGTNPNTVRMSTRCLTNSV